MPQRPLPAYDFVLVVAGAAVGSMLAICAVSASCVVLAAGGVSDIASATCTVTVSGAAAGAPSAASATGFDAGISRVGAPTVLSLALVVCADAVTGGCGSVALATWVLDCVAARTKPWSSRPIIWMSRA